MADLFVSIQEHHARILEIAEKLALGPAREHQSESERKKLSDQLIMEASRHEAAEEQYLWPAVRGLLESGDEMADHGVKQEATAKRLLHDLDRIRAGNTEFATLVRQVFAEIHDHATYEESVVLPALRLKMPAEDVSRVGTQYDNAHRLGPTRPHPLTPPSPSVIKLVGPAIASLDRFRDGVTGRGR